MSSDSERQESLAPVLSRSPFFLSLTLAFLVCPICGTKSEEESRNLQTIKVVDLSYDESGLFGLIFNAKK